MLNNFIGNCLNLISSAEAKNPLQIARIYLLINYISILIARILIKRQQQSIIQVLYLRGIVILISNWQLSKRQKDDTFYVKPYRKQMMLAYWAFFFAIQTPIGFISFQKIAISESVIIQLTNTIWSQFIAAILLKENLTWSRVRNLLISLCGIALIVRPPFLFTDFDSSEDHIIGCIYAFITSLFQAFAFIILKLIGSKIGPNITTQYYHLASIVTCTFVLVYDEQINTSYSFQYFVELLIISLGTYTSHLFFFRSISIISYAKLAPLEFSSVLISIVADVVIFHKPPELLSIIGILIVIFSIALSLKEQFKDN